MMNALERMKLKEMFGENADLIDIEAEIDSTLSYAENKRILTDKFSAMLEDGISDAGFSEHDKGEVRFYDAKARYEKRKQDRLSLRPVR